MEWPFNYHSKGRPGKFIFRIRYWSLVTFLLLVGALQLFDRVKVEADSSPPVADVEDLFKDEGFLRMSRGGEAFGRRPPPPPLLVNPPPHLSTQSPPKYFQTSESPYAKDKTNLPLSPSSPFFNRKEGSGGPKSISNNGNKNSQSTSNSNNSENGSEFEDSSWNSRNTSSTHTKPLEKDVNAVFSKVQDLSSGLSETAVGGGDSDAHPLLGITPAAPGDPFDFNPILSNPAVTRILAGSSGRIPQWEPMPDSHDPVLPEVNYTGNTNRNRAHMNTYHQSSSPAPNTNQVDSRDAQHNPKNPVFVPSPVNSNGSPTMYNMDQMTNNIAIPKHTLPNPSNLATSRSTVVSDVNNGGDYHHSGGAGGSSAGGRKLDSAYDHNDHDGLNNNNHDSRYNSNNYGSNGYNNHLDENGNSRGGDAGNPYSYDDEDTGLNEDNGKNYIGVSGSDAQGKRGIWKESGQTNPSDSNGLKYIVVCDALCGAWKHQCKLMGILFSITSVLCLVFAFAILYSLHFGLKDFVPFSIILLLLFTTSTSRAFLLLSGWFCSPDSRPSWLPIVSTLPSTFFTLTILVILRLARFPFPFVKSYTISYQTLTFLSLLIIFPSLFTSIGATFHEPSHSILTQVAWIFGHVVLIIIAIVYLWKFKCFYTIISHERGTSAPNITNGALNSCGGYNGTILSGTSTSSLAIGNNNLSSAVKKRGLVVKWGCLQARTMFGTALLALALSTMIIISVALNRGECEDSSSWAGWILSLCARMLEFAIVILLLLVTITSTDIRFLRLSRVPINKSNVGLMNTDIFPTMVSSNTAVQRCIPMYSSNHRVDGIRDDQAPNRSSLRGKTFGERALPGERIGEYRSSVGRGMPLRLGNVPSHSLPVTPMDGFPPGMRLPEPAPASLLVTKVVFGTPAVSREVNHQLENPLHCTGGPGSKEDRETSNIYASLESVKVTSMMNPGSSNGSNHSGSDRVLLSAPRDYIYSISRDLTRTIDSIYDSSRPRSSNLPHAIDSFGHPIAEQIGSIPNLNGCNRPSHFNIYPHNIHQANNGRADLARTIDRIRYAAATAPSTPFVSTPTTTHQPGRNFVLQLGGPNSNHVACIGNPPPYCSSESSHDVTPDSGIVADVHPKRNDPDAVYAREYRRNSSIEDIRRLPILPLPKQHRTPGSTPLYDRTPTTPTNPSISSQANQIHSSPSPLYIPNPTPSNSIVGRVEHLLNQTEHILSRTESLDGNSHSTGMQRLLTHKEHLEHVERLLAQAEYAIWLEKKTCAHQVSQMSPTDSSISPYGCNGNQHGGGNTSSFNMSANSSQQPLLSSKDNCNNSNANLNSNHVNSNSTSSNHNNNSSSINSSSNNNSTSHSLSNSSNGTSNSANHISPNGVSGHFNKKTSKNLEEESVV